MLRRAFLSTPLLAAPWKRELPRDFEAEVLKLMEVGHVPGVVIGTLQDGKPGWTRALGVRNIETREPMQPGTIFQAASLSKQPTAYAAFALRDQGKLDFDKPLVAYVDDLEDPRARTITARHVLSHSSGFPNWRSEEGQKLRPAFAPGSKFQYSGEGYFYLQRVMEKVTGLGFSELMNALVFEPLRMTSTNSMWKDEWLPRFAWPHDRRGVLKKNFAPRAYTGTLPDNMLPNGAASMITCAADYARFLAAAISNPGVRKEQINIRPALGWGLGWGIERAAGHEYLWQWGDNGGFKNFVAAEPATGNAIFVFTNGDAGARVYGRIVTHVTGHDHPALSWI